MAMRAWYNIESDFIYYSYTAIFVNLRTMWGYKHDTTNRNLLVYRFYRFEYDMTGRNVYMK